MELIGNQSLELSHGNLLLKETLAKLLSVLDGHVYLFRSTPVRGLTGVNIPSKKLKWLLGMQEVLEHIFVFGTEKAQRSLQARLYKIALR